MKNFEGTEEAILTERNNNLPPKSIMVATCAGFGCSNCHKNNPGLSFHKIPAANAQIKSLQQRWI